jgi:hypothetical protein
MENLTVHMRFRGLRWPFRPGDVMEFWQPDYYIAFELPYELVIRAIRLYIDGAVLQTAVAQQLAPRKPPTLAGRALKAQRQKNKGRRSA